VHAAGFNCPDLSSKHVLVRRRELSLALIDWQRSRRARRVRWPVRLRELAALHATLANDLATSRDRLRCLRAYLVAALGEQPALRAWAAVIGRHAARLDERRSFRELQRPPLARTAQRLRWVDGESLVVTRSFWRQCRSDIPTWLVKAAHMSVVRPTVSCRFWRGRRVMLHQFPPMSQIRRCWNWLRGRREVATGPRQGGLMFRQERLGEPGPRPLAFGQRPDGSSFILFVPHDASGTDR
jgi:hypothetical protein